MQNFLEKISAVSRRNKSVVIDFETQIRDSVYEAEDAIERYILSQQSDQDLDDAIRRVDSVKKKADQFKDIQAINLSESDDAEVSSNRLLSRIKIKPIVLSLQLFIMIWLWKVISIFVSG